MFSQANQVISVISVIALVQSFIPSQLRKLLFKSVDYWWSWLSRTLNRYTVVEVHQKQNDGIKVNKFYREVQVYLSTLDAMRDMDYLRVHRCSDTSRISFSLPPDETIEDKFEGAQLLWTHHATEKTDSQQQAWWNYRGRRESSTENKSFSLKMLKADRERILFPYFDHIAKVVADVEHRSSQRKLHTNMGQDWEEVEFKHPSTFDTLALSPPELKENIKSDLKTFSEGEHYYHSVGRAWKRGYLLYGPPGTGKSSMIAAMANFLHYDIYDLELTNVSENADLKSLLIQTTRKSIIVIEDIDCSLELSDRGAKVNHEAPTRSDEEVEGKGPSKVTLSGLLNFTDGLWSCCGEERIFVFTTNHRDRLDPALLRSGRMDYHILLSYCTFPAFSVLAQNYLGLTEPKLHERLKEVMKSRKLTLEELQKVMKESTLTPAEVVEMLISNKQKPDAALGNVMAALRDCSEQSYDYRASASPSPKRAVYSTSIRDLSFKSLGKRLRALPSLLSAPRSSSPRSDASSTDASPTDSSSTCSSQRSTDR